MGAGGRYVGVSEKVDPSVEAYVMGSLITKQAARYPQYRASMTTTRFRVVL